jgi:hypothetical protein
MTINNDSDAPLVPAIFANRANAEAAVEALKQLGVQADDIGLAVPARESPRMPDESERDNLGRFALGAAIGSRLGAIGGIGLAAVTLGPLGVGGLFVAGAGGMLWGGTVGGFVGLATRVRRRPHVDRWSEIELDEQSVLVVVRVRDWAREPTIAAALRSAGAVQILDHMDLDHTWQELELAHHSGQSAPTG